MSQNGFALFVLKENNSECEQSIEKTVTCDGHLVHTRNGAYYIYVNSIAAGVCAKILDTSS